MISMNSTYLNDEYIAQLKNNPHVLPEGISKELLNNKDFVLKMVKANGFTIQHASDTLKEDKDVIIASLLAPYDDFDYLDELNNYHWPLDYVSSIYLNDRDVVVASTKQYGAQLLYRCEQYRDDRDIVLLCVANDGFAFRYISKRLQDDREIVLSSIKTYSDILRDLDTKYLDDKEIVLTAVSGDGALLRYASNRLKGDREVVTAAVRHYGEAISFASLELQNDEEIINISKENLTGIEY